jgi:hypothetical protein
MTRRKRIHYDPANDLYAVLGVTPSATPDDLRRSFRQRAKEVHPDRNPDKSNWAHDQFERLNDAYDVLSDTTLRAEYDEKRGRYRRHRGSDGMAWWERPHPKSSEPSPPEREYPVHAPGSPSASPKRRRQPVYEYIYGRRHTYRPYQALLVISSLILFVSLCATITNPVRLVVPGATGGSAFPAGLQSAQPPQGAASTAAGPRPCSDPDVTITEPQDDDELTDYLQVRGTATDPHFLFYTVEIGPLDVALPGTSTPPAWTPTISYRGTRPVEDGRLYPDVSSSTFAPGNYVVRLTVNLDDGTVLTPCEVRVHHRPAF